MKKRFIIDMPTGSNGWANVVDNFTKTNLCTCYIEGHQVARLLCKLLNKYNDYKLKKKVKVKST